FLPWRQVLQPKWLLVLVVLLPLMVSGGLWYLWRIVDDSRMHVGQEARQQLQYVLTPEGIQRFIVAGMEYPLRFLSPACWFGPLGWLDTLIAPLHQHLLWISLSLAVLADGTALVLRLRRTGVTTLGDWLEPILGSLMHALFLWWSLALVMYLTITPYQAESIVGMQVRYMIPAMLFFLIWPVGLWSTIQATPSRYYQNACLFLFLMTILRSLFLARDLLFRYWQ
ncbi:MAG TPA: hypothetical protein PKD72_06370, partial [Gemmatales bacterium]|nr:hypothetical protein [Gemmatales bacterium]